MKEYLPVISIYDKIYIDSSRSSFSPSHAVLYLYYIITKLFAGHTFRNINVSLVPLVH